MGTNLIAPTYESIGNVEEGHIHIVDLQCDGRVLERPEFDHFFVKLELLGGEVSPQDTKSFSFQTSMSSKMMSRCNKRHFPIDWRSEVMSSEFLKSSIVMVSIICHLNPSTNSSYTQSKINKESNGEETPQPQVGDHVLMQGAFPASQFAKINSINDNNISNNHNNSRSSNSAISHNNNIHNIQVSVLCQGQLKATQQVLSPRDPTTNIDNTEANTSLIISHPSGQGAFLLKLQGSFHHHVSMEERAAQYTNVSPEELARRAASLNHMLEDLDLDLDESGSASASGMSGSAGMGGLGLGLGVSGEFASSEDPSAGVL